MEVLSLNEHVLSVLLQAQSDDCYNYLYKAKVIKWDDADSGTFEVDLGFQVKIQVKLRIAIADSWEKSGLERPLGLIAENWINEVMPPGFEFQLLTEKDKTGGFGRYLANILIEHEGEYSLLDDLEIELQHATKYERGGKQKREPIARELIKQLEEK